MCYNRNMFGYGDQWCSLVFRYGEPVIVFLSCMQKSVQGKIAQENIYKSFPDL